MPAKLNFHHHLQNLTLQSFSIPTYPRKLQQLQECKMSPSMYRYLRTLLELYTLNQ